MRTAAAEEVCSDADHLRRYTSDLGSGRERVAAVGPPGNRIARIYAISSQVRIGLSQWFSVLGTLRHGLLDRVMRCGLPSSDFEG